MLPQKITILIADDQALLRDGLQTILNLEEDMTVIGTAENGLLAFEAAGRLRPDLVLMDIQMPVLGGIEAAKRIKQSYPGTTVLILTTFAEDDYIIDGLMAGAAGFLLKDMPGDKLVQAIRDCMQGQLMMPAVIATKLAARLAQTAGSENAGWSAQRLRSEGIAFTERERQVIQLMMEGRTNRQIAGTLFMSEGTVKNYVSMIYSKIGTNDRTRAILTLQELLRAE